MRGDISSDRWPETPSNNHETFGTQCTVGQSFNPTMLTRATRYEEMEEPLKLRQAVNHL